MFWCNSIPSVSEPEVVLHVLRTYISHLAAHTGTFKQVWEQIPENYLDIQGDTGTRLKYKKIYEIGEHSVQTTRFAKKKLSGPIPQSGTAPLNVNTLFFSLTDISC